MDKKEVIPIVILLLGFLISIFYYPQLPEEIPTHWNSQGQIDDYSSKEFGLLLTPIIGIFIYFLFWLIPRIAVFKENIADFLPRLFGMKTALIIFFLALHIGIVVQSLGYHFNMSYLVVPLLSILFFYFGYLMQFVKRNFFVGFRTPWALSDNKVWNKTHKLASIGFRLVSILFLAALLIPQYAIVIFLILILSFVLFVYVYSYLLFKKIVKKPKL